MDGSDALRRGAAFFDFDKTLLHGDAGVIFGWTLGEWAFSQGRHLKGLYRVRHHVLASTRIAGRVAAGFAYRGLYALGLMKRSKLIELSYRFFEGVPSDEMIQRMEKVWNEKLRERLYPRMMEILEEHRMAGRRIVIVTTGLRPLVEHSRAVLGQDVEVIGVEMHESDGRWLGRVEGPLYGVHKAEAVRRYADTHGIDLEDSWAYSDHISDAAFLATVGHPVAVNPGVRLAVLARKKGWETLYLPPPSKPSSGPRE